MKQVRDMQHTAKRWLELIQNIMGRVEENTFAVKADEQEETGTLFATSRGLNTEPFIKQLLIAAEVLIPIGRLNQRFSTGTQDTRQVKLISRQKILEAAQDSFCPQDPKQKPAKDRDRNLGTRMLYQVDMDAFNTMSNWSVWTQNDGGALVSHLDVQACLPTKRTVALTNPSGQIADRPWDQP